jgi:hypothetical protein
MTKSKDNKKIVLALQGSFGHIDYATGLLDAFREFNCKAQKDGKQTLNITAGSGCVEMLTPLALYLNAQDCTASMRDAVLNENNSLPLLAQQSLTSPAVRPDAWKNFMTGLLHSQWKWAEAGMSLVAQANGAKLLRDAMQLAPNTGKAICAGKGDAQANMTTAVEELLMYGFGLPGQMAFNPLFTAAKTDDLAKRFESETGPTIFTNATRADNFEETYLYFGADPSPHEDALRGAAKRRQLLRLTPEYFFASGARPPYIAPMPVAVDGKAQHWMEGAMRCNPPLSPLIDVGATHIVLIRFFGKDDRAEPRNNAELSDRFLDAMFNIPLQKEVESIETNNQLASTMKHVPDSVPFPEKFRQRRHVTLLDPADCDNSAYSPDYKNFLNNELNALSHYGCASPQLRAQMFDRGFEIGTSLITHLQAFL